MKILAVDTATSSCSVAIVEKTSLLAEITWVTRETHSRHLMDMIRRVQTMAGVAFSDLHGVAVTRGPGSFTGLRIGISVVKGLCTAVQKPVVAVSSLEALAAQFPFSSVPVCAMIDARKSEVYAAVFQSEAVQGALTVLNPEQVLPPEQALADISGPCLFVGTGVTVYQDMIRRKLGQNALFAPPALNTVRAAVVAQVARTQFVDNRVDDVSLVKPHYIRKSDAELKWKRVSCLTAPSSQG